MYAQICTVLKMKYNHEMLIGSLVILSVVALLYYKILTSHLVRNTAMTRGQLAALTHACKHAYTHSPMHALVPNQSLTQGCPKLTMFSEGLDLFALKKYIYLDGFSIVCRFLELCCILLCSRTARMCHFGYGTIMIIHMYTYSGSRRDETTRTFQML